MVKRRALILGITGQDGSYIAEILKGKGYEVHGVVRRSSTGNMERIKHIEKDIVIHHGDLLDSSSIQRAIEKSQPDEIYNEADQDNVGWSRSCPMYSYNVTFAAVGNLFELIRRFVPCAKVFQPVSATMFEGSASPQNESAVINPQSPYACAKTGAYYLARYYREKHNLFIAIGIMFNHDSPRRSEEYLVHKICNTAIRINRTGVPMMILGNLDYEVDIGHAEEFMYAAHAMLQLTSPDDFVIATGVPYTIRELAQMALSRFGLSPNCLKANPEFPDTGSVPLVGDIDKAIRTFKFCPQLHGQQLINSIIRELL